MKPSLLPRGLVVDLITPLNESGAIDDEGLGALLARVLPHADGILLAGPRMGEGRGLGLQSKRELLKKVCTAVQARVPIFFWISEPSLRGTKELLGSLMEVLESTGYAGSFFWVDSPLFYHSNRGLHSHYRALCASTSYPLVLYNDASLVNLLGRQLKRGNIRTGILKELSNIQEITALIFRGSLARANNYQRALNQRPDFKIYDGDEARFLEHPSLSGVLSAGANIAPRFWSRITKASLGMVQEGEKEPDYASQILEMGQLLGDLNALYERSPVWMIKKALSELGVIRSPACTAVTQSPQREDSPLAAFISKHSID
jgi:dihydrodipicolinate synthase/N-acetylneuraminate lyase